MPITNMLSVIMLNGIMLRVIMQHVNNFIRLNVINLSAIMQFCH